MSLGAHCVHHINKCAEDQRSVGLHLRICSVDGVSAIEVGVDRVCLNIEIRRTFGYVGEVNGHS
jgi:hypothetical protein